MMLIPLHPIFAWSTHGLLTWVLATACCGGLAAAIFFLRRRWGWASRLTDHPFTGYVLLSLIAHLMLALWVVSSRVFEAPQPGPPVVTVDLGDDATEVLPSQPWNEPPAESFRPTTAATPMTVPQPLPEVDKPTFQAAPAEPLPLEDEPLPGGATAAPEPARWSNTPAPVAVSGSPSSTSEEPSAEAATQTRTKIDIPPTISTSTSQQPPRRDEQPSADAQAEALASDRDESMRATDETTTIEQPKPLLSTVTPTRAEAAMARLQPKPLPASPQARSLQPLTSRWRTGKERPLTTAVTRADGRPLPTLYRDRRAANRDALVRSRGGSEFTEAAVRAALAWLASHQSSDGRWDASRFDSGRAILEDGQDRRQAGRQADTGVTGLALLAFLGSGDTHREGDYADTVRRGVEFLLAAQRQRSDGSVAGSAGTFAAMYCHGIATLALSECYAMSGDVRLLQPVQRAVAYSLAAQHPVTGGWRYRPQEPGDTSQLGWQLMALTSAHYGGIPIPRTTWQAADRFLQSVAWGSYGGLAAYRAGERPSRPMTAEALMCRLFLGTKPTHPLVDEAANFLMGQLPGQGRSNYYYWYYGTLALYPLQDTRWERWNQAVQQTLLGLQDRSSAQQGSWDPDSVWGGSGGRVYTTALAALTLEVYYRYRLPSDAPPPDSRSIRAAWNRR